MGVPLGDLNFTWFPIIHLGYIKAIFSSTNRDKMSFEFAI